MKALARTAFRLLAAGLAATLAAGTALAQGPAPEKPEIRVGIIPISNMTPLYIAQKLGYFKDNGLTVNTTGAGGGPALMSALIGGSLDFIYTNYVSAFQATAEGFDLIFVAHQNSAQISPPDAAPLVVRSDGQVAKPADLVGKRIAINALRNINHIAILHYLEKNGIAADKVRFIEMPFPNMVDALLKNQADAVLVVEPFVTLGARTGKVRALAYPFIDVTPDMPIAGFATSRKFLAGHPVTVERFVGALARANNHLNGNREELIKYTAEYTKSSPDLIREITLDRWSSTVDPKDLQLLSDLSFKYGMQKRAVKASEIYYKTAVK